MIGHGLGNATRWMRVELGLIVGLGILRGRRRSAGDRRWTVGEDLDVAENLACSRTGESESGLGNGYGPS